MRSLIRLAACGLIALVVVACTSPSTSAPSPSSTTPASEPAGSPSAPASHGDEPSEAPTAEPIPSDELSDFTCDLPIVEGPSAPIANIVDLRIGEHDGYDRVVFEQGTPELTLDRATPPFTHDASGMPIDVEGTSFLGLLMRGGTKQTDEGTSSYDGPTESEPGGAALLHLVEGGDFERQSTWYFGLSAESCVRVLILDDPHRLVIDIEH